MDWYRSKLILETEDPSNFQPIFDKWEEIAESRSLLKIFVPVNGNTHEDYINAWGTFGEEHSLYKRAFFKSYSSEKPPLSATKLEATFSQPGWSPYVGYRRLSYLLPGVTIYLYDPDMDKDSWQMHFLNGQSFGRIDYTLMLPALKHTKKGEAPLGGAPWLPYSEEDAQVDIFGSKYFWDLEEAKMQYPEV